MVKFDSQFTNMSGYEQIYNNRPAFTTSIKNTIDVMYSKEFLYLKEVGAYQHDWDSYNGKIPDQQSIHYSIKFLSSFTNELKISNTLSYLPEFYLAPDGILGFEWDYARNANLFARIYSLDKIEYSIKENNKIHPPKEMRSEEFMEMCKQKIQYNQAA